MTRASRLTLCILALAACLPAARGGESDLSSLTLGKTLMGPPATQETLAGNVVMVEFWGTH